MNRSLVLLACAALGLSAFAAACSSESSTPATSAASTDPGASSSSSGDLGDATEDDDRDDAPPDAPERDAGSKKGDAGKKDPAPEAGPAPVTKADIQALFDARCAPCHVGNTTAGLSLANDFTTSTVGVASTQVPGMKRIAPGNKEASYLFHKLRGTHLSAGGSGVRMPRNGPYLGDSDIDRVGAFIDAL